MTTERLVFDAILFLVGVGVGFYIGLHKAISKEYDEEQRKEYLREISLCDRMYGRLNGRGTGGFPSQATKPPPPASSPTLPCGD